MTVANNKPPKETWTLTQSVGWTLHNDPKYKHIVEVRSIRNGLARRIYNHGGLTYMTYQEAYRAAYKFNYPNGPTGKVGEATGLFRYVPGVNDMIFVPLGEESIEETLQQAANTAAA